MHTRLNFNGRGFQKLIIFASGKHSPVFLNQNTLLNVNLDANFLQFCLLIIWGERDKHFSGEGTVGRKRNKLIKAILT